MHLRNRRFLQFPAIVLAVAAIGIGQRAAASATDTLRIASYNIEADVDGVTTPRAGLYQVLEGIGEENISGDVQPVDIVGLQETTSNSTTVAPIVSNLNAFYNGTAVYAQSTVQGTESGNNPNVGNGPNSLIYNTTTLNLISSVGVGTPQGATNGEFRQVMRYEFEPVGGTAADIFYVYVSHMKSSSSGTLFTDETERAEEAAIIRSNEATLVTVSNPNPQVLYMGDYNLDGSALITSGSQSVSAYQVMTAPGPGQAVDPLNTNPQNNNETWDDNPAFASIMTESAKNLQFRDDLELMTSNVYNGSGGLDYVQGSLHAFGNNGSVGLNGSVASGTNTALEDLESNPPVSRSAILTDLTTASDHLPVVADFTFAVPGNARQRCLSAGATGVLLFARRRHTKPSPIAAKHGR